MTKSLMRAVSIIWIALLIVVFIKWIRNYLYKRVVTDIAQKGIEMKGSTKRYFKYSFEPIFSQPINGFKCRDSSITLEIIYRNENSQNIKLATIGLDLTNAEICRDLCCFQYIRGFFTLIRYKPLPPITRIRAVHNSVQGSQIYFEGIELQDQMTGERIFYSIRHFIVNSDIKCASVHFIQPIELWFCSKQTFSPDFKAINIETFGQKMTTADNRLEEPFGIIVGPKLTWVEEFIFYAFLIQFSFTLLVAMLSYSSDSRIEVMIIVAVLTSGLIAPTVTQIIAYVYRFVIKSNYNSKCSQMKVESNESSILWRMFRSFYLIFFVTISLFLFISTIAFTPESVDHKVGHSVDWHFEYKTEMIFVILMFVSSTISLMVWLPIFSIIRFLYRFVYFKPQIVKTDIESDTSDITSVGVYTPSPPNSQKDNRMKGRKGVHSPVVVQKKTKHSSDAAKSDKIDYDLEDNDLGDKSKIDELNTGSVIITPTKSLGYIDPEMFRLSESRIESPKRTKT